MFSTASVAGTMTSLVDELQQVATKVAAAGVAPQVIGRLNLAIDAMQDAGPRLLATTTNGDARAVIVPFLADANSVLGLLALLPLPPQAAVVLRIAQLLLPAISGASAVLWPAHEGSAAVAKPA